MYKVIKVFPFYDPETFENRLNELYGEGWELDCVLEPPKEESAILVFKEIKK